MSNAAITHDPTNLRIPDRGIREHFALRQRWQAWLDVEVALAKAEAELGIIPRAAAEEIERKAKVELLNEANVLEGLRRTAHPLVPLVWELSAICEGDAGGYVHWGATTQNITQTGEVLLLREVHHIILAQLRQILGAMAVLARRTRDFAIPGRTHGQHAVPVTFGYKVAVWIDETLRHVERLRGLESRVFTCMLGGAAGTFASFGDQGFEVQRRTAEHLDLKPMTIPSRAIGDHYGEYVSVLGLLAATCHKIGAEVYELMKDEFGEVEEPVPDGTVGSSTMPQKRNPKLA